MRLPSLVATAVLALSGPTLASQFYVFPVKEIEGVSAHGGAVARPLVDTEVARQYLPPEVQRELLAHFVAEMAKAFPSALVHARQVGAAREGSHRFVDDDNQACGVGAFTAPLGDSYAAVLGVTRASRYEVDRGNTVETLVPLTLNLQLIKPDKGKPVLAVSDTVFTPFQSTRAELGTAAQEQRMRAAVVDNLKQQVSHLVAQLRKDFNPQPTTVRVIGRDGALLVIDKGFEAGFESGDEPDAQVRRSVGNTDAVFRVLSAQSGLSVVRAISGKADVGDELSFVLGSKADDSLKPRLMPVTTVDPQRAQLNGVATLFARQIGFRAAFQMAPVDVNFADSMSSIKSGASCIADWNAFPGSSQVKDSRSDTPAFFLRLDSQRTPVFQSAGAGGTRSSEEFSTLVSAEVVDGRGRVVHSDLAIDTYRIDRVAGSGLHQHNAFEVSLKNATLKLAESFVKSARLEPREFTIDSASRSEIQVAGLNLGDGEEISFRVLRPLSVQVGGRTVLLPLDLDAPTQVPRREGQAAVLKVSITSDALPPPRAGDIVRVDAMPRVGGDRLAQCRGDMHVGDRSFVAAPFAANMVAHAIYRSPRYGGAVTDPVFYGDLNRLLDAGYYKARLNEPAEPARCFQPGYVVRQEAGQCEGDRCNATVLNGMALKVRQQGAVVREVFAVQQTALEGFSASQRDALVGFRAMELFSGPLKDLIQKVDNPQ